MVCDTKIEVPLQYLKPSFFRTVVRVVAHSCLASTQTETRQRRNRTRAQRCMRRGPGGGGGGYEVPQATMCTENLDSEEDSVQQHFCLKIFSKFKFENTFFLEHWKLRKTAGMLFAYIYIYIYD